MTARILPSALLALLAAATVAACSDDAGEAGGATTSAPTTAAAPTTTAAPTTSTAPTTAAPAVHAGVDGVPGCAEITGSSPAVFDAASGMYAATVVSREDLELTFDVVQFVTGVDAAPNDFAIENESTQTRTAPVAEESEMWSVSLGDEVELVLTELPDFGDDRLYWLTFLDGTIVEVCEQYLP